MGYQEDAKRLGAILYVVALLLAAATVAGPLLVRAERSTAQVVLLAVALGGSALLAFMAGRIERDVRGEGFAIFATPGVLLAVVFHALFWTSSDPGTARLVIEGILAGLLALSGPALGFLAGLGAGLTG